jgi:hypothetical protein
MSGDTTAEPVTILMKSRRLMLLSTMAHDRHPNLLKRRPKRHNAEFCDWRIFSLVRSL